MPKTQTIYYISSDDDEEQSATKLKENLSRPGVPPIEVFNLDADKPGSKAVEVPEQIILLAHTDDTRANIGNRSPEKLAKDIAAQFKGKDKSQLKSLKLAACEGGFGEHPLALALVKALHNNGFTNVVVQAAAHPKESTIGGVVSVTTRAGLSANYGGADGQMNAVMYGNQITADFIRYKSLSSTPQRKRTQEQNEEIDNLAKAHNNFKNFNEEHPNYCVVTLVNDIDDLDTGYNTYTPTGPKAQLSFDAAVALDYLRTQRNIYAHPKVNDHNAVAAIDSIITQIKTNSTMDKNTILQKIDDAVTTHPKAKIVIRKIKQEIEENIDIKREAIKHDDKLSHGLQMETDYLGKLLAKNSILDKVLRYFLKTDDFTRGLSRQLKVIKCDEARLNKQRNDIMEALPGIKKNDKEKMTNGVYDTPTKKLHNELENYLKIANPQPNDWKKVSDQYEQYKAYIRQDSIIGDYTKYKSPALEAKFLELKLNVSDIQAAKDRRELITAEIKNVIDVYLQKHSAEKDPIHDAKRAVMEAIRTYVNSPSEENWKALDDTTKDKNNKGWDKGWFSEVAAMKDEADKFHTELSGPALG